MVAQAPKLDEDQYEALKLEISKEVSRRFNPLMDNLDTTLKMWKNTIDSMVNSHNLDMKALNLRISGLMTSARPKKKDEEFVAERVFSSTEEIIAYNDFLKSWKPNPPPSVSSGT